MTWELPVRAAGNSAAAKNAYTRAHELEPANTEYSDVVKQF
jgi:hypothetical protein